MRLRRQRLKPDDIFERIDDAEMRRLNILWHTMQVLEPDDPLYLQIKAEVQRILYPESV